MTNNRNMFDNIALSLSIAEVVDINDTDIVIIFINEYIPSIQLYTLPAVG